MCPQEKNCFFPEKEGGFERGGKETSSGREFQKGGSPSRTHQGTSAIVNGGRVDESIPTRILAAVERGLSSFGEGGGVSEKIISTSGGKEKILKKFPSKKPLNHKGDGLSTTEKTSAKGGFLKGGVSRPKGLGGEL